VSKGASRNLEVTPLLTRGLLQHGRYNQTVDHELRSEGHVVHLTEMDGELMLDVREATPITRRADHCVNVMAGPHQLARHV
jgi:hypothetical protein